MKIKLKNEFAQIRYDFYTQIRSRVEYLTGGHKGHLHSYSMKYENELLNCHWQIGRKKELFKQIEKSQVVFVGDFHAQIQSTRSLLRLARKMKAKNFKIGLECFFTEHQQYINQFLNGELSEKDFLRKIEWKKNWGFPWEYTRPLMKWASQNHVQVIALNKLGIHNLKQRDKIASELIVEAISLEGSQILIQFGDFHLAKTHLPELVKKLAKKKFNKKNIKRIYRETIVLQSPEVLYFKMIDKNPDFSNQDLIQISDSKWAIMSVVPWVKWQDYLLYLETGHDKKIKIEDYDLTDYVVQAIEVLKNFCQIQLSVDDLSVYSVNEEILFKKIQKLPPNLRKHYKELVVSGQSFFCPELKMGFVARPSVNQIAKVSALYVLNKLNVYEITMPDYKKSFLQLIWLEMLIYFLTKLINPKKKSDTFEDIRRALRSENFSDKGKEALLLSLEQKLKEIRFSTFQDQSLIKKEFSDLYKNKKSYLTAAQILGGILGEKLFTAYQKKMITLGNQSAFLFKNLHTKNFKNLYYESIEVIDSWPSGFKSKFDRL